MSPLRQLPVALYQKIGSIGPYRIVPIVIILAISVVVLLKDHTIKGQEEGNVLAVIENRIISEQHFLTRYRELRSRFDLPEDGRTRRNVLNAMVEEELFIAEAENRGYHKDSHGRFQRRKIQIQALLDAFHHRFISDSISVSEQELRDLFVRFNTKIKARHLYAPTLKKADSLYAELRQGKSYEELSKLVFQDPQLRDSGGALGYFTVDEMDPFFEDAAFALQIGKISRPVRTSQGFSIILVQDRITNPLLTASEFARRRPSLERYWRTRKIKYATRSFVDSLRRRLEISFHQPTVTALLHSMRTNTSISAPVDGSHPNADDALDHQELVRSKLGAWNVKTFHEHAQFTSEQQAQWVRHEEQLENFIGGLVVRAHMLSRARELGLDKTASYQKIVRQRMEEYLLERMEQDISDGIVFPEDSLRAHFRQHEKEFRIPPKIRLREIVLNDVGTANAIKNRLANNASFEQLAQAHSMRSWSAENQGEIGSFTERELGSYAGRLFPLEVGQWAGPVKMEAQFVFLKCVGREEAKTQTFEEARSDIEKVLKPIWQRKAKQILLESIRTRMHIAAFPEKLNSVRLN